MSAAARRLLLPLNPAYRLTLGLRELRLRSGLEPVRKLRWPVVSVGGLSAGGAGKTPMTIALAKAISSRGFYVDVLSRGYGRQSGDVARVRPDGTAAEFGDEPLLIAQKTDVPVFVAARRFDAGEMAESKIDEASIPGVHILDDGFQHRQLHRDIDILLVNRADWHGMLLPAGNLREPRSAARRAQVIAIPAEEPELERELRAWGWQGSIWHLRRAMEVPAVEGLVAAFCGIARADQFFSGLERAGLQLAAKTIFRDHHPYTAHDLDRLVASARARGAVALMTTEKDRVRMGALADSLPEALPLLTSGLRLALEDEAVEWLVRRLTEVPA